MFAMRPGRHAALVLCLLAGCATPPRVPVVAPPPHEQSGAPMGIAIVALPSSDPAAPAAAQVASAAAAGAGAGALAGMAGATAGTAGAAALGAPLLLPIIAPVAAAGLVLGAVGGAWLGFTASVARDMAAQVGRDAGLAAVMAASPESIGRLLEEHIGAAGGVRARLIRDSVSDPYDPSFARALRERGYGSLIVVHGPQLVFSTFAGPNAVYVLEARTLARLVDTSDGRVVAVRGVLALRPPRLATGWTQDAGAAARVEAEAANRTLAERIVDTFVLQVFSAGPPPRELRTCGVEHSEPRAEWRLGMPVIPRVDSLTPRLAWALVPRAPAAAAPPVGATDARFDLRLWRIRDGYADELVVERVGLAEPTHRVDVPLAPATTYGWSVRMGYRVDGRPRASHWSGQQMGGVPSAYPSLHSYEVLDGSSMQGVPCWSGVGSCGCWDAAAAGSLWQFTTP